MADELNNENTNECHKHLPKVRVCDIKPSYKFEKKHVTLYDFDEEKVIEEECDELLEQKIRKVCNGPSGSSVSTGSPSTSGSGRMLRPLRSMDEEGRQGARCPLLPQEG